jgi:hypothetical protein
VEVERMNRMLALAALAALACGSVNERPECGTSADCAVGQYCAVTPDGNVCWADASGPTAVAIASVSCADPCLRDGVLDVVATAEDAESGILSMTATLRLGTAEHDFPLVASAGVYQGQLDLSTLPFPFLATTGSLAVTATNGSKLEASTAAEPTPVITRVRWTYGMDANALTAPAVKPDGTVVVGRAATSNQVLLVNPNGVDVTPVTVEASSGTGAPVTVPPSVGAEAIWVSSEDGRLYGVALDGSGVAADTVCTIGATLTGPPALRSANGSDTVFVAATDGSVWGTTANANDCNPSGSASTYASSPVIDSLNALFASTESAMLRRFTFNGSTFTENWTQPVDVGSAVTAPLAVDGSGNIWTASVTGELNETTGAGVAGTSVALTNPLESPVVLANGDIVVGDATGKLHRISSTGAAVWATPTDLGSAVLGPIVLAGGDARILVSTKGGSVFAIADDGSVVWSGTLSGAELRTGNIFVESASRSTAYFSAKNGNLYAVIVDGHLDTSAPWPKAWHDPRNTGNAATPF